jgi:hypothetical protein
LPETTDTLYDIYIRRAYAIPKRTHYNLDNYQAQKTIAALVRFAPEVKVMVVPHGEDIWGD